MRAFPNVGLLKIFRFILHHSAMHVKGLRSISTHPFFTRHGLEWTTPVLRPGRLEAKRSAGSPTRALSMQLALKTHRVWCVNEFNVTSRAFISNHLLTVPIVPVPQKHKRPTCVATPFRVAQSAGSGTSSGAQSVEDSSGQQDGVWKVFVRSVDQPPPEPSPPA